MTPEHSLIDLAENPLDRLMVMVMIMVMSMIIIMIIHSCLKSCIGQHRPSREPTGQVANLFVPKYCDKMENNYFCCADVPWQV